MPMFEYMCEKCNFIFEELKNQHEDSSQTPCIKCGVSSQKIMSACAAIVNGGSTNETPDMYIGREANKRWQAYTDRQTKRRGDNKLEILESPKTSDGKYVPVMGLGDSKNRSDRKNYVNALQKHRTERKEKGIPQFNERGAF
jgi:putative FmdB family regulatory protein